MRGFFVEVKEALPYIPRLVTFYQQYSTEPIYPFLISLFMGTLLISRRILWVNLQIESIWEDCFCDSEIQAALADLPKDLNETYRRCVERINTRRNKFASQILCWVCAAVNPFTIEQLCEAWAIYVNHGRLDRCLMPSKQDILRSCSNLITRDSQDHVLLAHHSVLQFLVTRPEDHRIFRDSFSIARAKLELGELCITHLTSEDYSLAVQHFNKGPTLHIEPTAAAILTNAIPSFLRFAMPKLRPTQITLPLTPKSAQSPAQLSSFFHFARDQWASLTSHLSPNSGYWDSFRTFALQQNLNWRMHPWVPLGQSAGSHYSGLLGWAIANRHRPLIDILVHTDALKMPDDIFNLPLYHHNNLLPLHLAARIDDVDILSSLLPKCDPEKKDLNGWTAIHNVADVGSELSLVRLLDSKVKKRAKDNQGRTALHIAAGKGHSKVVANLLWNGLKADMNSRSKLDETPIEMAIRNGHGETVHEFLKAGANFQPTREVLANAAKNEHEAVVKLLLERVEVKLAYSRDNNGQTLLQWAVENGDELMIKLLLERVGVGANLTDDNGQTPLQRAVVKGHEAVVKLLLERHDVDADSKDKNRWTPLQRAAENGHEAVVKLLLKRDDVNINSKNKNGLTPLQLAAAQGHKAVFKLLLERDDVDIDLRENSGQTRGRLCKLHKKQRRVRIRESSV